LGEKNTSLERAVSKIRVQSFAQKREKKQCSTSKGIDSLRISRKEIEL